jgi:hypothetical protein
MLGIAATLRPEPHNSGVEAEINRIEADALAKASEPSIDTSQQLIVLGKPICTTAI